jgi:4-amino-4-deoxy-L-arabinose transferase-like glycosyltransferase
MLFTEVQAGGPADDSPMQHARGALVSWPAVSSLPGDPVLDAPLPRVILPEGQRGSPLRFTLLSLLLAGLFFAGIAPTLTWLEFSSGSENLVVGTALEMHRGSPWIIPTLKGEPRTAKPPLPTWICAALIKPSTVSDLSVRSRRDAAYRTLAWEVRWPSLLTGCLALFAAAWLGRLTFGDAAGFAALAMMGTSFMFLRFSRSASTDVPLMLWVTAANVFFAAALLRGYRWIGCALGGLAIGLALMSKGPVALAQTVFPLIVLFAWRWWDRRGRSASPAGEMSSDSQTIPQTPASRQRIGWLPILLAAVIAIAIALPWPIWALWHLPGQLQYWFSEVAEGGTKNYRFDPPWIYLSLIPLLLPWAAFFFLGIILLLREKTDRARLIVLLVIAPILLMACFTEKNDRYLLPMLSASAIICAVGFLARGVDVEPARKWIAGFTWLAMACIAILLPVGGATLLRQLDGQTWWTAKTAIFSGIIASGIVVLAWKIDSTGRRSMIPAAIALMIWSQALFVMGYSSSARGLSDGRPVADGIAAALPPDAKVWYFDRPGRFSKVPIDVVIYLNRIVYPVSDLATLGTEPHGQVVLVHCRRNQPMPPAMRSWKVVGTASKNGGTWYACVPPG